MSSRGDDRPYKVVYASRRRDDYDDRRSRREVEYEDDYRRERAYPREYRDDRIEVDRQSRISDSHDVDMVGTTRTRYAVGRDRNAESYVKRTDAVVVEDRPSLNSRYDYEVLRPQRQDDGTYVVDLAGARSHDYDIDRRGYPPPRYEIAPPSRRDPAMMYESARGAPRERALTYRDVHVTEEIEDDRYSRRGREPEIVPEDIPPPIRLRSAMRDRSRPDLRRTASVGFYRDQISHHDASESRHERPGAEAHLAGRYLEGNTQYDDDDLYAAGYTRRNRSRSRSRSRARRYGPQRSDPRLRGDEEYDDDRRTFTEETMRNYEYEDERRPAYPPQRGQSRSRRHRRHHDDDDERYSTYDTEVVKTRKEYYR
jgi:hypothetical protein